MKKLHLILGSMFIFLISCNPCEEIKCPPQFTQEELGWLPYSLNDQLVFDELYSSKKLILRINNVEREKLEPNENQSPYCQKACYYQIRYSGDCTFDDINEHFGFTMDKIPNTIRFIMQFGINDGFVFNLTEVTLLDSLNINDMYVKDVYKYTCEPEQEEIEATYMHQGLGLVKIVFRDGRDYELVEHRKAK